MAQYDEIAEQYKKVVQGVTIRLIEFYSLQQLWGDMSGKSVLDLACGEGMSTRIIKRLGAERVVGVDQSARMVELGREEEAQEQLGIEYIHCDVAELDQIGEFDIVTAAYLLHYAPTKEILLKMCQAAYRNLKPGHSFITSNTNVQQPPEKFGGFEKYGFIKRAPEGPLEEGGVVIWTLLLGDETVDLETYYFSQESYDWAFATAGFKSVTWQPYQVSAALEAEYGKEYWQYYVDNPCLMTIEAKR
jgi:ubiquinone/menaquinone biosynthesis C-methylase UbiE